jgi:leucyl-tRNA synthetase
MAIKKYIPTEIEKRWQDTWLEQGVSKVELESAGKPYYLLVELPYSSGDLHIGHWFTFGVVDIFARFKRLQGYQVFYPMGFDAFGLPAENAAIKRGLHPRDWTLKNIETMTSQFKLMGTILDWEHVVVTCQPEYYKWNQWIFLKMLEKGIAYKGQKVSNWCPVDQTILADEQVINGHCDRCGSLIEQKEISQWLLKITEYAGRLIWEDQSGGPGHGSSTSDLDWPKSIIEGQNNWIGKSEGIEVNFDKLKVYTTRPDTLFGVTFMVISPEHPLLNELTAEANKEFVKQYVEAAAKKNEQERKENKEKTGVFTGSYVSNPLTGDQIPVWVADYVLLSYGTGAIMAVPAHDTRDFEFAKKFDLPIKQVIAPEEGDTRLSAIRHPELVSGSNNEMPKRIRHDDQLDLLVLPFLEEGVMVNSGEYDGLSSSEAREKISDGLEKRGLGSKKTQFHLHDWSISRQRYWGTPIPIINCPKCGAVPVPEKDLPVELPYEVDFRPKGKPPLASNEEWLHTSCPECGGEAEREAETMDGFVDNSWYFYRYLDPHNNEEIFNRSLVEKWLPVKIYFGGAEHTLGHTLYSRFFTKFFYDLGLTPYDEYAQKRVNHGVILGPDGARMSKSKGNVVNPDEQVQKYGADAVRLYLSFIGPYDIVAPWNPDGINGIYHFLQRVWGLFDKVVEAEMVTDDLIIMHKTLKKVTEDLENHKFNTAISSLMEWLNYLSKKEQVSREEYKIYLTLLAPFAPHMAEELWEILGEGFSIHQQSWPKVEEKYLETESLTIVVQVNGKVRDSLTVKKDLSQKEIEEMAMESEKIQKFLDGKTPKKIIYIPGKILSIVI